MIPNNFLAPYLIANAFAVGVLAIAFSRPRAARWVLAALFAWAAAINTWTALTDPQDYVNYAALAASSAYRAFIRGWFSQHVQSMVIPIAAGQLAIACLLALPSQTTRRLGELGAIVFLLAIAPLGVGSGFPFSLTTSAAVVVMERRIARRGRATPLPVPDEAGIRTIDDAVSHLRDTGQAGWPLVAAAQSLVARRMRYSRRNPLDTPSRAFRRGEGYCQQKAMALHLILTRLGVRSRPVRAARCVVPPARIHEYLEPSRIASHAWLEVTIEGLRKDVCPGDPANVPGRLAFIRLSDVKSYGPVMRVFGHLGSVFVNIWRDRAALRRTGARRSAHRTAVKPSPVVLVLVAVIAKLAAGAAGIGLFYHSVRDAPIPTTVEDAAMKMYGHGIYQYDSMLVATGFAGVDAVTLFLAIPVLLVSAVLYHRGSVRGGLLLTGTLAYFLYNYASMALGAAYNSLFLVYVALFSASLFAFVLAFASFDLRRLPSCFSPAMPHRVVAAYLLAVSGLLLTLWLGDVVAALARGSVPQALGSYTTVVTYALDLGIVAPAALSAAVLLLRRTPAGYLLASTMLTVNLTLGAALMAQGAAILMAGIQMPAGQIAGMIGSFAVLGVIGVWLTVVVLRGVSSEGGADSDVRYAA